MIEKYNELDFEYENGKIIKVSETNHPNNFAVIHWNADVDIEKYNMVIKTVCSVRRVGL